MTAPRSGTPDGAHSTIVAQIARVLLAIARANADESAAAKAQAQPSQSDERDAPHANGQRRVPSSGRNQSYVDR